MWELSVLSLQLFCVQKLFSNLNCIQTSKPSVTRRPNQAPRDSLTVNERGSKGQSRSLNTGWVRNMRLSLTCPSLPSPGHPIQRALELMTLKMWGGGDGGYMPEGSDGAEPGSHAPLSALTNLTNNRAWVSAGHPRKLLCAGFLVLPSEVEGGYLETGDFSFITHHIHKEGEVAARGDGRRGSTVGFLMLVMDR